MQNTNYLPEPYHISFAFDNDVTRGNIFRPVQPYGYITPNVEMIIPPLIWIGYEVYLIKNQLLPKEDDCLFLNPDYGEFYLATLWKIYGNKDVFIGRDWASTRSKDWFFNSKMQGRRRSWPDDISRFIKSLHSDQDINDTEIIQQLREILGYRFIRLYEQKTENSINEKIKSDLIPLINNSFKASEEEILKELTNSLFQFINKIFLMVKRKIKEEYEGKDPPKKYEKFFQNDIVNQEYNVDDFIKKIFGNKLDDVDSLNNLEQLASIVTNYANPNFSQEEIRIFLSNLDRTERGRILLITFLILDYASILIQSDEQISNQIKALNKLEDDTILLNYFDKILEQAEGGFKEYIENNGNIPNNLLKNPIEYNEIEKYIHYWTLNFFVYFGEKLIRNEIKREKLVEKGISIRKISKIFKDNDEEISFIKRVLTNHYVKISTYLDEFIGEIEDINRSNFQHLTNFFKTLKEDLNNQVSPHEIYFNLLKTNQSFIPIKDKLIPNQDSKERFYKISHSVVFPGRDGIISWYQEILEMRGVTT